jgi:elongation factor Ts
MAEISAKTVNELRQKTGLGLMECKKLLQEAGGDLASAETLAKERNMVKAGNRAGRATKAGRVEVALEADGTSGALVALSCETDFVARNEEFRQMAKDLAEHTLKHKLDSVEAVLDSKFAKSGKSVRETLVDLNARTGENVQLTGAACFAGAGRVDAYVHHDGTKGALVQLSGPADAALVRDLSMHAVASRPAAVRREEINPEAVAEQKRIFLAQMANDEAMKAKPEQVREKIATGKLEAWFKESAMLDQEFVKDPTKKVHEVLGAVAKNLTVARMARFAVGEAAEGAES